MNRTSKQNASLHVYLSDIASSLNDAGIDFKTTVQLPVSFTQENIKEYMFKPVMNILYPDIDSTTKLDTKQMQEVYDVFNRAMGEKFGVSRNWPSLDNQLNEHRVK